MELAIFGRACWPMRGIDGDTVDFLVDLGEREYAWRRYRLLGSLGGVNTPELHRGTLGERAAGKAAQQATINWLMEHVAHNTITLSWPDAEAVGRRLENLGLVTPTWECPVFIGTSAKGDEFGRWLVDVHCQDGHDLGDWLLSSGNATPWTG